LGMADRLPTVRDGGLPDYRDTETQDAV
jgi:hypothetical protein